MRNPKKAIPGFSDGKNTKAQLLEEYRRNHASSLLTNQETTAADRSSSAPTHSDVGINGFATKIPTWAMAHAEESMDYARDRSFYSSGIYDALGLEDAPSSDPNVRGTSQPPGKEFVLVEASKLKELTTLEHALRKEKRCLESKLNGTWMFSETEATTCDPTPYIANAVRGTLGFERESALKQCTKLRGNGLIQVKSGYHETPQLQAKRVREIMYKSQHSSIHDNPLASFQKRPGDREVSRFGHGSHVGAERLRLHMESKRQRRDRLKIEARQFEMSAMATEEAWQRHMDKAIEAENRLLDFDLYLQIVHKYGPMEDDFFRDLPRPGAVYRHLCHQTASRLEHWWRRWWPERLAKKGTAATQYQTGIRAFHARKRFLPIFKRIRFVQDRFYRSHFVEWGVYVAKMNRARSYFDRILFGLRRTCFEGWTQWLAELKEERLRMLRKAAMKILNRRVSNCFGRWSRYTQRNMRVRRMMARAMGETKAHLYELWRENARAQRKERVERLASTELQRMTRGLQARQLYGQMKRDYRQVTTLSHLPPLLLL
jgi:hypothetical protein